MRMNEPRLCANLLFLFLCAALVTTEGCFSSKPRQKQQRQQEGVGFQLEGSSTVMKGALLTTPRAREEMFLPFVASHAASWAAACDAKRAAGEDAPSFAFVTDESGAVRASAGPGASAFEACLGATAAKETKTSALPAETTVRIQLALAPAKTAPKMDR